MQSSIFWEDIKSEVSTMRKHWTTEYGSRKEIWLIVSPRVSFCFDYLWLGDWGACRPQDPARVLEGVDPKTPWGGLLRALGSGKFLSLSLSLSIYIYICFYLCKSIDICVYMYMYMMGSQKRTSGGRHALLISYSKRRNYFFWRVKVDQEFIKVWSTPKRGRQIRIYIYIYI